MNTSKFLVTIACLSLTSLIAIQPHATAQSQAEMNQEAASSFDAADKELNVIYKRLVSKIDRESQAKLKAAQNAWVAFRDTEADMMTDFEARGGSIAPLIYNGRRAQLTKARTLQLNNILKEYGE